MSIVIIKYLDFVFATITTVTVGLTIWHMVDENVGTDIDWLIAILFGLIAFGYNIIVNYTIEVTWNRLVSVAVAIIYTIITFLIMKDMTKGSLSVNDRKINKEKELDCNYGI